MASLARQEAAVEAQVLAQLEATNALSRLPTPDKKAAAKIHAKADKVWALASPSSSPSSPSSPSTPPHTHHTPPTTGVPDKAKKKAWEVGFAAANMGFTRLAGQLWLALLSWDTGHPRNGWPSPRMVYLFLGRLFFPHDHVLARSFFVRALLAYFPSNPSALDTLCVDGTLSLSSPPIQRTLGHLVDELDAMEQAGLPVPPRSAVVDVLHELAVTLDDDALLRSPLAARVGHLAFSLAAATPDTDQETLTSLALHGLYMALAQSDLVSATAYASSLSAHPLALSLALHARDPIRAASLLPPLLCTHDPHHDDPHHDGPHHDDPHHDEETWLTAIASAYVDDDLDLLHSLSITFKPHRSSHPSLYALLTTLSRSS